LIVMQRLVYPATSAAKIAASLRLMGWSPMSLPQAMVFAIIPSEDLVP
jgi:hypothetical protein